MLRPMRIIPNCKTDAEIVALFEACEGVEFEDTEPARHRWCRGGEGLPHDVAVWWADALVHGVEIPEEEECT